MKRYAATVLMLAMLSPLALAHGKEQLVLGTVREISDKAITVEVARSKESKTIAISGKTKFLKSGEAAAWTDLRVGDRVAISVDTHGEHLEATVVKFGKPKAEQAQHGDSQRH